MNHKQLKKNEGHNESNVVKKTEDIQNENKINTVQSHETKARTP